MKNCTNFFKKIGTNTEKKLQKKIFKIAKLFCHILQLKTCIYRNKNVFVCFYKISVCN